MAHKPAEPPSRVFFNQDTNDPERVVQNLQREKRSFMGGLWGEPIWWQTIPLAHAEDEDTTTEVGRLLIWEAGKSLILHDVGSCSRAGKMQ